MEINENIGRKEKVEAFIEANFVPVNSYYKNPIFPYKINYRSRDSGITFCSLPIVDCWILKCGTSYTFFMLIRNVPDLVNVISNYYGSHSMESSVEIDDRSLAGTSYFWERGDFSIILSKYLNIERINKYENCRMINIGNMPYKSIVSLRN
jgi:hypothetical protein